MKSYHILDCPTQQKIADSLYGYYVGLTANKEPKEFWNHLSRKEIQDYFSIPNNPCKQWFDDLGLRVRDMSFTMYNDDIGTDIHRDEPPVVAKINLTCSGGSSTILSKALNPCWVTMWASSKIKIL